MTEFHAGEVVAGYRLEARLGGGGYGVVWRARRLDTGRVVAIKLLPEIAVDDDDARGVADAELLAASAARNSPHIVQVLDGGTEPVPFVVMEFVAGTSLAEELRERQRLSQQETIDIGIGIAEALRVLNEVGIVHRDVKPSNVMIDRDGVVKLTDFGIAKIAGFDNRTQTGDLRLSIAYAAPEVWEGHAEHRSDLYALAVVLFQCLSGQLPFRGGYAELFYQHRNAEPDFAALPPDLAPSLLRFIQVCLAKSPEDRLADAAACVGLLNLARQEAPATGSVAPLSREPERFGPWLKLEPVSERPWIWSCRNERSGEEADVEVHFAATADYGETLRRAVAVNPRFVALGGQRLLQTNRLILRPGEAWNDPPPGSFQFWLATGHEGSLPAPALVTAPLLLRVVESLSGMIDLARNEALPLDLEDNRVRLTASGVFVQGPGVPAGSTSPPEDQAIGFLRGLPLSRDLRAVVDGNTRLEEIQRALSILVSVRPEPAAAAGVAVPPVRLVEAAAPAEPKHSRRRPALIAAGLLSVVAAVVAAAVLAASGGDGGPPPEPTQVGGQDPPPTQPPALVSCLGLDLPATLNDSDGACGSIPDVFVFNGDCERGRACSREGDTLATIKVGRNTQTHAFIDADGKLRLANEAGEEATPTTDITARDPTWSPNGRYLAYVHVQELPPLPVPTPAQGQQPPPAAQPRFSTQLRVVEAGRPANDGIVVATNGVDNARPWLQRYISSPQWSPDGRSLYFLWSDANSGESGLHRVDLPLSGSRIDFGRLRGGAPASETVLPSQLVNVGLSSADFGVPSGRLGRFSVLRDGSIYVQVCDGADAGLRCGLGRWTGQANLLRPLEDGVVYGVPQAISGDGAVYASVKRGNEAWRLLKLSLTAGAAADVAGIVIGVPGDTAMFGPPSPRFALERSGDSFVVETVTGQLAQVGLTEGGPPLTVGRSPAVFIAAASTPTPVATPRPTPFHTPTPTPTSSPTPTPTATPAQSGARPMSLNLNVRRASVPVTGATVVVFVDDDECATGTSNIDGRLFLFVPRDGAPARCNTPGVIYRFRVNGVVVPNAMVAFSPQGNFAQDLVLPP